MTKSSSTIGLPVCYHDFLYLWSFIFAMHVDAGVDLLVVRVSVLASALLLVSFTIDSSVFSGELVEPLNDDPG